MDFLGVILPFLLVLTVVVFIHELGHYLVGRWCGIHAEAFSIGFGPEIFGFVDGRGTRWRLALLPLGGYVKFVGDRDPSSARPGMEDIAGSFQSASLPSRAATVAAGPVANFILSIVIFASMALIFGEMRQIPRVDGVVDGSPAAVAGFREGDVIVDIDGYEIDSFADVSRRVVASAGAPMIVVVERGGLELSLQVQPRLVEVGEGATRGKSYQIGIQHKPGANGEAVEAVSLSIPEALMHGVGQTWFIITSTIDYISGVISGRESGDQIGGPVRIAQISGQVADMGLLPLINLIALLSTSFGLINLFPMPILDGGHLLYYGIEAITGKPVSERVQEIGAKLGIGFVLFLMVYSTWNDLTHLGLF